MIRKVISLAKNLFYRLTKWSQKVINIVINYFRKYFIELYICVSVPSIFFAYCYLNSGVYIANITESSNLFKTTEASSSFVGGIFSAFSLLLLIFNFIYQSRDSTKKEQQYLSQQFSQNFNDRLSLYKTLLSNIHGDVVHVKDSLLTSIRDYYVGVSFLEKELQYVNSTLNDNNIVQAQDVSNNTVSICNLCPIDFESFNEPFYELFPYFNIHAIQG